MKKMLLALTLMLSFSAQANESIDNVTVTQLSAYSTSGVHFVWFSSNFGCGAHAHFDTGTGGKDLYAMLTAAIVSRAKLMVFVTGDCTIHEVYLKAS